MTAVGTVAPMRSVAILCRSVQCIWQDEWLEFRALVKTIDSYHRTASGAADSRRSPGRQSWPTQNFIQPIAPNILHESASNVSSVNAVSKFPIGLNERLIQSR